MRIRQQFVDNPRVLFRGTNKILGITIHETANKSVGANAAAHANLQSKKNPRDASWHWQVDDKECVQSFRHDQRCMHSGAPSGRDDIAIEICVNSDGDFEQAVRNAAALVRKIIKDEGLPPNIPIRQHFDHSGKNCPTQLRSGRYGVTWDDFISMIREGDDLPSARDVVVELLGTRLGKSTVTVGQALQTEIARSAGATSYQRLAPTLIAQEAQIKNLVSAIGALSRGETFDEERLLAGIRETVQDALADAVALGFEIDVSVTPKTKQQVDG